MQNCLNFVDLQNSLFIQGSAEKDKRKFDVPGRVLSATFADLPAPELEWEKMAPAPVPRLDGAAIQIKNLLYVFAGYGTIDFVRPMINSQNTFFYR